jgi:thiosulfate/3-mercaptopyruvate sulfurtransferase
MRPKDPWSVSLPCLVMGLLLLAGTQARAQGPIQSGVLVSTAWMDAHLGRPDVIVVHVGDPAGYDAAHIPGARFVDMGELGMERAGVQGALPPLETLIDLARSLGIDGDTKKIVLYGPNPVGPAGATRLFQALDYLGLGDRLAFLDGQFAKWVAEGRPTTDEVPTVVFSEFLPAVNPSALIVRSTVGDLMGAVALRRAADPSFDGQGFVLFDSRFPAQYEGGHIPGARLANPLSDFVGGGFGPDPRNQWVVRDRRQIVERYHALGLEGDELAIASCHTGTAASILYYILRYAGFQVTLYDGSLNEWSTVRIDDETELEIWRSVYGDYPGNADGKLPLVAGPDPW